MNPNPFQPMLDEQRQYFRAQKTIPVSVRKETLRTLKKAIKSYEKDLEQALQLDLNKSSAESYMAEIGLVYEEIDWQIRHLSWNASAHCHITPIHEFPSKSQTVYVPYGNVLVMAPWNYPFLLAFSPMVQALAAGNTVILKPGHYCEHTAQVMYNIIESSLDPCLCTCVLGGRENISALLELDFDYIFFTGGKRLGSLVMESAAKHMIPATLELGGKSPCVVDETANLALAAKRIVFGKFLNAGQTCVAPDYVVVHESVLEPFINMLAKEISIQYPDPAKIGKIITEAQYERLVGLVNPGQVVIGGRASANTRQIEPTVMLLNEDWDAKVMDEEIFGPILPILVYSDFRDLMHKLQAMPTPLAFYLFSRDKKHQEYYKYVQPFGGGCINDTVIQLSSDNLPFGGMGASGMGQYHGKYGYATFSHIKAIVSKSELIDLPMRYTTREPWMEKLLRTILK